MWLECRDSRGCRRLTPAGWWQALPGKPQTSHSIPKAMGKEGFKWDHDRVSFTFYNSSDCYLKQTGGAQGYR